MVDKKNQIGLKGSKIKKVLKGELGLVLVLIFLGVLFFILSDYF